VKKAVVRTLSNSLQKNLLKTLEAEPVNDLDKSDVVGRIFRLGLRRNRNIQVKRKTLSKWNEGGDQSAEYRRHPSRPMKRKRIGAEVDVPVGIASR
jgi:hypothetical protein